MAEIGKKTLRSWRRLARAQSFVADRIEAALKGAGLPALVWLAAFDELEKAGEPGLRPFELQRALELEQPAVSRLLDKMIGAGMAERRECDDDRRGWTVTATDSGRKTQERMATTQVAALTEHYLAHLSDKQARTLDEILGEFLSSSRASGNENSKNDH
ncbi:MAG: MarR family transcriptional regulator [Rhodoblastus sp.]|nr:MarR family transcriptional regulator [Rhodoblastus sp.]